MIASALQHMFIAAKQARGFVSDRTRADLDSDPMLARACSMPSRKSEAASRSRPSGVTGLRASLGPEKIVGMRHRLVHGYGM